VRSLAALVLVATLLVLGVGDVRARELSDVGPRGSFDRPLRLLVAPVYAPDVVKNEYLLIVDRLQRDTGYSIRFGVSSRMTTLVQGVRRGMLDIVIVPPAGLRELARRGLRDGLRCIASQVINGRQRYRGLVVVRRGAGVGSLAAARGKALAVPHLRSESGFYRLEQWCHSHGTNLRDYFGSLRVAGGHVKALGLLKSRTVTCAAISELALTRASAYGIPVKEFEVIHRSEQIPFDAFCVSASLPEEVVRRISLVLLASKERTPEGGHVIEWRRATDATYVP